MTTVAQRKASAKYDRNHTRSILFKFNTTSDADILAKLDEEEEVLSVEAIGLMVLPVVQKYGIDKVTLFGSYARGEATAGSDIDLLIECDNIRNMESYLGLQDSLKKAIGRNVDIVMADALEADNTRSAKRLREHIERDKVIIYERIK